MDDAIVDRTLDHDPSDRVEIAPLFGAGTTVGHFRIERELGAGGMGLVLEAYDPDLDRQVAIKVVRGREAGTAAGARLVREAQAMAKLSHPNVVAVHEVGTFEGHVFVVMELVRGETLGTWLATKRTWREIVEAFASAGEGLVAAHHAGIVHRDFKPSNVLVDHAGRIRVGDFGLARTDDADPRLALGSGSIEGTLAYMAPEQRLGGTVDARADQYAFGISLQNSLARARTAPPRRVKAAIVRALSIEVDARFPTMEAVLVELRGALARRRRVAVAAAVAVPAIAALAGLGLAWGGQAERSEDPCLASAALVDEIWNAEGRLELAGKLRATRPLAGVSIESTLQLVDDWSSAWKLGRRAACAADRVHGTTQLACLDRGLHELRAQVALWRVADGQAVDRAVAASTALPPPAACATSQAEAIAAPIAARIATVHALQRAGRAPEARPEVAALLGETAQLDHPATTAAVRFAAGTIASATGELDEAREHLKHAARHAGRAHADHEMIEALLLEAVVVTDLGRPLDSLGLLDAATALIERTGLVSPRSLGRVRGDALSQAGRLPEAIAELERAVATLEPAHDLASRLELAKSLGTLAAALNQQYEFARAHALLERGLAIEEAILGANHPEVGQTLHDLGTNDARLERYEEAIARIGRARDLFRAVYGKRHFLVGACEISLANVEIQRGNGDLAEQHYLAAQAALEGVLPAAHPHFAIIAEGLGSVMRDRDRCGDAIVHFERAVAIYVQIGRPHGQQSVNLGACLADVGRDAQARPMLERALTAFELAGVAEAHKAEAWALLAEIEARAGHRARAIALAEKVLAVTAGRPAPFEQLHAYMKQQLASWR